MMNRIIFWNIRSVNSQQAFERLTNLNRRNQYWHIGLMEPFQDSSNIEMYERTLGHHTELANCSGKFWLFVREELETSSISDTTQQSAPYSQYQVSKLEGRGMDFGDICSM